MRYLFPLSQYNQQRQFEKPVWVYPVHLAMYATYLRNNGHEVYWDNHPTKGVQYIPRHYNATHNQFCGFDRIMSHDHKCRCGEEITEFDRVIENDFKIDIPFEKLPFPDREFTDAKNPRWQSYGNYRKHPATHMMVSNLCWYGKCTFCIDTAKLQTGEHRGLRSVNHVIAEIDDLIAHGYKEVFDDSGTFPVGQWLEEFCKKMQSRKKHIMIGCNMKPIKLDYKMMANAGFKFMLVGIESINQSTIDRIQKGQRSEDIIPIIKSMADAGLAPHTTWMSNYPFETFEEEKKSIEACNFMLRKGYAKTAQASVYCPPRTAPLPNSEGHKRIPLYFDAYKHPEFWYNKIKDIRGFDDISYMARGGKLILEEYWRKYWKPKLG